ncbi:hypothetical protein PFISCL1PPCAC_27040 [Pristionchus fissidentatus]|uniref:Uncharacterized protein n=1 Tax=Pristionchus fissidentatus TaxID=1538716 RepID=A0AAV5WZV7_9BILA|nr:hypothetical protein PFISCL1PPCAC_27040 [Pristionchus fissidentatus]
MAFLPLRLLLFSSLFHLSTQCTDQECDSRYQCSNGRGSISAQEFHPQPRSIFLSPCSCNEGWNEVFCSKPEVYSKAAPITPHTPTVCICRKHMDSNLRCEQFLTRCYKKSQGGCKCCFMQDEEFCDAVECLQDRPLFQDANTTCACFSNPVDYPMKICERYEVQEEHPQYKKQNFNLSIMGVSVPAFLLLAVVASLLLLVALCTMICLVVSGNKRRKRELREREARERREGRGEGESFLPSH